MPMRFKAEGVAELVNRISKFDQDVYKILTKEVRAALTPIAEHARRNTPDRPLSNWGPWIASDTGRDLGYTGSQVRRGIKPQAVKRSRRGQVAKFSGRVVTMTPAGAIFALAGSKSGGRFEDLLNDRHEKRWPRTLSDALYAEGPKAAKDIEEAIQKAAAAVTGRRV